MNPILKAVRKLARTSGHDIVKYKSTLDLLTLHGIDCVIDIGANSGGYATEIREMGWTGPIVSIEPQPKTFVNLANRFSNDTQWKGLNIGMGSADTTLLLNIHEMDVLSSFLEKIELNPVTDRIQVPVKRMDGILDELLAGKTKPFVKIDTQGFELEIIKGFGSRITEVIGWQLELSIQPLYDKQPAMEEVVAQMKALGFSLWKILPGLRDPKTHQAFEFDGIFFKNA